MKNLNVIVFLVVTFLSVRTNAQISKNGARTVTTANAIVNEYTTLTADATAGATTLQVAASGLNANGRFSAPLSAGDLLMIIQIQGASLNGTASGTITIPNDITWGSVTSYNNCGNYEFVQVNSVPNATSIVIDCGLQYSYTSSGKVQVIRVPRYSALTINSGASVTCDAWNGSIGGVVAIESGTVAVNGSVVATGKGFRGGQLTGNDSYWNLTNYATISTDGGGEKGEGIFGYQAEYNVLGGSIGRGAPGNGGGGGNGWSNGGGGGANGGNTAAWNGQGNPDVSVASWTNAWNLESAGFSGNTSSGGGRGGYSWSSNNQNATTTAPGNSGWGGDLRVNHGGLGGRPLDYSTGKIFLGGGGGAGDQDNSFGGVGGAGGGLIFIHAYSTVTGTGTIVSNGNNGANATGTPPSGSFAGKDAAGGGGAGGTILLRSQGVSGVSVTANGGEGGDQVIVKAPFVFTVNEAEGPGGGGGGGYIAVSSGTPVQSVLGGVNGTTNSDGLTEFLPNGATKGGAGSSGQSLSNYTLTANNASICSGSSATISVTLSGTTPGGSVVTWYDSETGGNVLGTGTSYTTSILTANTTYYAGVCPGYYRIPVNVTIVPGITVNVNPVNSTVCAGNSVTLTASGGTSYTWSPSGSLSASTGSTVDASPAVATTYTVTGTTGTCTDTAVAIVAMSTPPVIAVTPSADTLCAGSSITLTASGATSFSWTPSTGLSSTSLATITASPSVTTTYTVTGTDASGCFGVATVPLFVAPIPSVDVTSGTNSICEGSSVVLTATGALVYSWSPGTGLSSTTGASVSAQPTSTITYTVAGVNTFGCLDTAEAVFNVTTMPIVASSPAAITICSGGSVALTATGAASYEWSPTTDLSSATGPSVNASPTATITYTVTGSQSGCTDTATTIVTVTPSITASVSPITASVCSGSSVTLTASGGSSFSWSPSTGLSSTNTATVNASPSSTTTYTVTASAAGGCGDTTLVTVTVNPIPVVDVTPASVSICPGESTTLDATGALTYTWSPSAGLNTTIGASVIADPTVTTTYTVTGTNADGCSDTSMVTVNLNLVPAVSVTPVTSSICAGGSSTLTASGATNYTWSPLTGLSAGTGSSVTANPSSTQTYTVTGETNGCTDTAVAIVNFSGAITVTVTPANASICAGSNVTLDATGATSYEWFPSSSLSSTTGASVIATPSSTSTYTVTGTLNGCTDTALVEVSVVSALNAAITSSVPDICEGDTAQLTATGGATYNWEPSTGLSTTTGSIVNANPAVTTTYTVIATSGTCSDSAEFILNVNSLPLLSVTATSDTICEGNATTIDVTGATSYVWLPSSSLSSTTGATVQATPLTTETFTVAGFNSSCGDTITQTIVVEANPIVDVVLSDDTICSGISSTLTASGATSFTWSPSAELSASAGSVVIATPSATATYTVTGTTGNCSATKEVVVEVTDVDIISNVLSASICEGDSVHLTLTGADSYTISPMTGVAVVSINEYYLEPIATTTYELIGTMNGCTDTIQIPVTVSSKPILNITTGALPICEYSPVTISVTGATSYEWSPATLVDDPTSANVVSTPHVTSTLTVTGTTGGCSAIDTVIINVVEVTVSISASSNPVCEGTSTTLIAAGANTYDWDPSPDLSSLTGSTVTATPLVTSTYTVIGTGTFGCVDTASIEIEFQTMPVATAGSDVSTCQSSVLISSTDPAPYTGIWSIISGSGTLSSTTSSNTTVDNLSLGTTVLTWTVSNPCATETDTLIITTTAGPDVILTAIPQTICPGSSSTLTVSATGGVEPYSYSWSNSASGSSQTVSPSVLTSYEVQVTDVNGCTSIPSSVSVSMTSNPIVVASSDVTIVKGESTVLSVTGATAYEWTPIDALSAPTNSTTIASPLVTTVYTVTGTDAYGCTASDEVTVTVEEKTNVFIPDIFSPNNDGRNDVLYVRGGNIQTFRFMVFDRWGEMVFETQDKSIGWDGTLRGRPMDEAVYVYVLKGTYLDGSSFNINGNVTLIR